MSSRTLTSMALAAGCLLAGACASSPPFQGMTVDEIYAQARQDFDDEDWDDAIRALERVRTSPGFSRAAEAQMLLADAYFRDEKYIIAQDEYTRFLDRYPQHPDAASAALGVCRSNEALSPISQRDQTFTEQALAVCSNVARDYGATPQGEQAATIAASMEDKLAKKLFEAGAYYLRRDFYDSAIIYYESVLDLYPGTVWAPRSLAGIIEAYTAIGYEDLVETARERLRSEYPESPEARALNGGGGNGAGDRPTG